MGDDVYVYIDESPAARPRKGLNPWLIGCLVLVGLVLAFFTSIGLLMEFGRLPDSAVVAGDQVSERMRERLLEYEVLGTEDELYLFYSWGLFDIVAGGSVLSSAGVVMWYEDEGEPLGCRLDAIPFAAIRGARLGRAGSLVEDGLVVVETAHLEYYVPVSAEADGPQRFLDELLRQWESRGGWRPDDLAATFESEFEYESGFAEDEAEGAAEEDR